MDTACASLPHVLKLYYSEPPTDGLEIVTDKSLWIDGNIMVRPYLFKLIHEDVIFSNMES